MKTVSHMSRKYAGPANHNSRSDFKVMSSNIDPTKTKFNWYWNIFTGDTDQKVNFKDVEKEYYTQNYTGYLNAQNARNIKQRHPKRCRTMDQYMNGRNTKPHEQIVQFGDEDDHPTKEELLDILKDYVKWYNETFPQAVILDMALHMDETTPHIHIRRVLNDKEKTDLEYQTVYNQYKTTMNAVKEAERTKRAITEANKSLTEENKELTEENEKLVKQVDEHREALNKYKKAVKAIEKFLDGHEKRVAEDIERMYRDLPDFNTSQTDDGYDY